MKVIHTLSGRLTLYTVATFAVLLMVCFNLLFWSMNSLLMQRMDDDLIEDVLEFSHMMASGGVADVIEEIDKETAAGESDSVFLMVFNDRTDVVFSSNLDAWQELTPDTSLISAQLLPNATPAIRSLHLDSQEAPTRLIYGALSSKHVLVLGESTEDKEDITSLLVSAFSIVFLFAVPIAALLVWLVTRRTVSGIHKVSIAARGITKGELGVRVDASGELEEVQTLADTFDAMANRIQSLIHHMREMTDNISHDLRSPLGRIRLLSESMLHSNARPSDLQDNAQDTINECDRLIEMINLSLDVAEAEAGMLTLAPSNIDISYLISETCEFFTPAADFKQIVLQHHIQPGCHILADTNSLQRLLSNLLDNALKYTPAGGTIDVSTTCENTHVNIVVSDNGVGIPAKSIKHVFDRFYRADTSRGGKGCGLGLSYAHAVARAHGGELTVKSEPDHYTTFTLLLPASEIAPNAVSQEVATC